ncbi:MAG: GntR family transcriptional regulator [Bacillota bacterium]|jgi:DNA-binding transcriptional MocR family regulator|nr:GntR family transcriptional regulator [Bacillota bacterium]
MEIHISREGNTPIYLQIKNQIKEKILEGELVNGFKLPPERKLAEQLHVHRNTVIKAYCELVRENLIFVSTAPRGYLVTYAIPGTTEKRQNKRAKQFTPFSYMVRDEYLQMDKLFGKLYQDSFTGNVIPLAVDIISPSVYPKEQLNAILTDLMNDKHCDLYGFCDPQGREELRASIVRLLAKRSIKATKGEIQIVSESYAAMDNLIKLFVSPGDTIIAEEPILVDTFHFFRLMGVNLVTVPMDKDGMRIDYLEGLIAKYHPKFIYTIPTFHFPSGITMSLKRRYELLDLSYKYNIPVIEEDCDSILRYEGAVIPCLKALDQREHVIYVNSFVATICPGVRVSYLVAPEKVVEKISRLVGLNEMFINSIGQYLVTEFLDRGFFGDHVSYLCRCFQQKRDLMCRELELRNESLRMEFDIPKGGTSIWCRLNQEVNQHELLKHAYQLGVIFTPGHLCFPYGNQGENQLRLCYGNASDEEIRLGVELFARAKELCKRGG